MSLHFANQVPYANIHVLSLVYLPLLWWLETQFFKTKLMAEKISCFEMKNFRAFNTLKIYLNISKIRLLIQITLCRNARVQMDLSKNNRFSAEEAKNYISRTEKRKAVPVCEMLEFSWSLSYSIIPILSLKKIAQRQLNDTSII